MKGVNIIKLWIDDMREPPDPTYLWCRDEDQAISAVIWFEHHFSDSEILIDIKNNISCSKLFSWLEGMGVVDTGYFFRIHTTQFIKPEGAEAIIEKNGWRLIK